MEFASSSGRSTKPQRRNSVANERESDKSKSIKKQYPRKQRKLIKNLVSLELTSSVRLRPPDGRPLPATAEAAPAPHPHNSRNSGYSGFEYRSGAGRRGAPGARRLRTSRRLDCNHGGQRNQALYVARFHLPSAAVFFHDAAGRSVRRTDKQTPAVPGREQAIHFARHHGPTTFIANSSPARYRRRLNSPKHLRGWRKARMLHLPTAFLRIGCSNSLAARAAARKREPEQGVAIERLNRAEDGFGIVR